MAAETWVINASPLIALGRIDCLRLPRDLANGILIPDAVLDEIKVKRARVGLISEEEKGH